MTAIVERVLLYEEALAEVLSLAQALRPLLLAEPQSMPLLQAADRVLAAPLRADRDQPPFPRSTRDGYALRAADLQAANPLAILGTVRAGERWPGPPLGLGQAIEIMTGAPMPAGADAVLMVEHATLHEGSLKPDAGRTLCAGDNVVPRGAEAQAGSVLVPAGRVLGAAEIALAASCGYVELAVYPLPRVAILATGDELVEVAQTPGDAQIRNSNSYALAALVRAEHGEAVRLPVAHDTLEDLHTRIAAGRDAGLLLLSGGVSMGKYDLVEEALREAGAEFLFTGAKIQPGRPLVFGRLPGPGKPAVQAGDSAGANAGLQRPLQPWTYFFGLPGNPVSTEVCFRLFVTPLLRALAGCAELPPRFAEARLAEDLPGGTKVTRFQPAEITGDWRGVTVRPVPWHGSGDLAANARANGFVVLPLGVAHFAAGETVRVLPR